MGGNSRIVEVRISLSVMLEADSDTDAVARIRDMSIEEIDTGDMIGGSDVINSRELAPDAVRQRLLHYGNDGTFFDDVLEAGTWSPDP